MSISVLPIEQTSITIEQLYVLIKTAFQERKEAGLNYVCLSMTIHEFMEELNNSIPYVAIDREANVVCGCTILKIQNNKKGLLYGLEMHTSVDPKYKNRGIGSMLINAIKAKAIEMKCAYLYCSTAISAKSAIRVHLKNGYKIVGMASYPQTNYYSYRFRLALSPLPNDNFICRKFIFIKSALRTLLLYNADGSNRRIYYLLKRIKEKRVK